MPLLKTASGSGGSAFQSIMPSGVNPGASVQLSVGRAAVINISTAAASITENEAGNSYAYRVSKTAMNQATRNLSVSAPTISFAGGVSPQTRSTGKRTCHPHPKKGKKRKLKGITNWTR